MILILASLFFSSIAQAAPCCSSNSSLPSLISGDDRAQIGLSTSRSSVIGDAPEQGPAVFRSTSRSETTQTLKLHSAWILTDQTQIGMSLPMVQHEIDSESHRGVGDAQISAGYEILPEWSYSKWRPKGITFLQVTLPTGRSIYESKNPRASDVTGKGYLSLQMGSIFTKTINRWDLNLTPEVHSFLSRKFESTPLSEETSVGPGWGASLTMGGGYSFQNTNWRLGIRIQPSIQWARSTETSGIRNQTTPQKVWDTSIEAGYLWSDDWNGVVSYNDQTLLGPAQNTTLDRTFALLVQRHFAR